MKPSRAPQRIKDIERRLYVKALRLANDQPEEIKEITELHRQLFEWMNNDEKPFDASRFNEGIKQ